MKKKAVIFFLVFLIHKNVVAQDYYKQQLSNIATINFPTKPIVSDTAYLTAYTVTQDSAKYLTLIADMKNDPSFDIKSKGLDIVYEGFIDGQIKQVKGIIISKRRFEISNLKGIETELVFISSNNKSYSDFKRLLFVNKTFLNYDFICPTIYSNQLKEEREKYLNSFTIIADPSSLKQFTVTSENKIYGISFFIGQVIGYVLIITAIIVGSYFLVKKIAKKRK